MRCFGRLLVIILLLYPCLSVSGQRFAGNPASTRWQQINTDTVRVIYPQGLDSTAQRVANVVHVLQRSYHATIGNQVRKINIVLQKDIALTNGYVGLAPYRSEFYLMAPQNPFELGAQRWADNLAIHEYRHVQQYSNFNRGWSKVLSVILGQEGQALANAASVPDWFFEGDAVFNETLLSEQGRGRLPFFFNGYKALQAVGKKYDFMKLRNGSLKDYVPSHYQLGYLLVAYGRSKYGNDVWKKITQDAAAYQPLIYPLQGALKKYTGKDYTVFVQDALDYYERQWKDNSVQQPSWITGSEKNNVVDYQYPYPAGNNSIIALKTSRKDIPWLVHLDSNGLEKRISVRDIAYDDYFSYNNGRIIYSILKSDIRWGNREYSLVKILDVASKKETIIRAKAKYFSPDISADGSLLAAVEMMPDQSSRLILMNENGGNLRTLLSSAGQVFSYPKIAAGNNHLYFFARDARGYMSLQKIEIATGIVDTLLPFSNTVMGFPLVSGDTLTYTLSNNGSDEQWAFIQSSRQAYKLASYTTGMYQGFINSDGRLTTSAFTANGYRLAKMQPLWQRSKASPLTVLYSNAAENTTANNLLQQPLNNNYAASKYNKAFGLLNFHSWRPYYDQPEYSFSLYGQNVLNTMQSRLYYVYNTNESSSKTGYTAIYGGWYVQPVLDVNHTWHRSGNYRDSLRVHWNEWGGAAGLQLPLNLSGGKQYRYLTFYSGYNYRQVNWTGAAKQLFANSNLGFIDSRISYSGQVQKAPQHIYPHWAQTLQVRFRNIISNRNGYQLLARGTFYLPGLYKTHSLALSAAYQRRDTVGQYLFSNDFPTSRGYRLYDYPEMWLLSANYHFPLLLPDWGFGNIVYFQRIRLNAFFDYTNLRSLRQQTNYPLKTTGMEIFFDTKWWNQQPVSFGLRYSRLLNAGITGQGANQFEFILPVGLIN